MMACGAARPACRGAARCAEFSQGPRLFSGLAAGEGDFAAGGEGGEVRARSHCRFVQPPIHFIPDALTYSVPVFLKRQCDRTPGGGAHGDAAFVVGVETHPVLQRPNDGDHLVPPPHTCQTLTCCVSEPPPVKSVMQNLFATENTKTA